MNGKLGAQCLLAIGLLSAAVVAQRPKILVLHGGGGNGNMMRNGVRDLTNALSGDFDFAFPSAPYSGGLWMRDPPGGKGAPTTNPDWAVNSITYLNNYVRNQGPFVGIMGYSQGAAFVPVYLAQGDATFEFAAMFCGYVPNTHQGIVNSINNVAPFSIPALVWMGANDGIISNSMTREQATLFISPDIITSASGGHEVPSNSDPTFSQVRAQFVQWANGSPTSTESPTETVVRACGSYRRAQGCRRAEAGCRWAGPRGRKRCRVDNTTPISGPTGSPTVPQCGTFRRGNQCRRAAAGCRWIGPRNRKRCVARATPSPTIATTPVPTVQQNPRCGRITRRMTCGNNNSCYWYRGRCYRNK